jgi:hypothetical protein
MEDEIRQLIKEAIRGVLIQQADLNEPISYGNLCRKLKNKIRPGDNILYTLLGEISKESADQGKGLLSVFVGRHGDLTLTLHKF